MHPIKRPCFFEFRLLGDPEHALLVFHGVCEIFFDLALYPCMVDVVGCMLTRQERVHQPLEALDIWEDMQDWLEDC